MVEVEVGSLPTTAETITFTGRLIDGSDEISMQAKAMKLALK